MAYYMLMHMNTQSESEADSSAAQAQTFKSSFSALGNLGSLAEDEPTEAPRTPKARKKPQPHTSNFITDYIRQKVEAHQAAERQIKRRQQGGKLLTMRRPLNTIKMGGSGKINTTTFVSPAPSANTSPTRQDELGISSLLAGMPGVLPTSPAGADASESG